MEGAAQPSPKSGVSGSAVDTSQPQPQKNDSSSEAVAGAAKSDAAAADAGSAGAGEPKHHTRLLQLLAEELGLKSPDDIVDFELNVCDTQPGTIGGGPPLLPTSRSI